MSEPEKEVVKKTVEETMAETNVLMAELTKGYKESSAKTDEFIKQVKAGTEMFMKEIDGLKARQKTLEDDLKAQKAAPGATSAPAKPVEKKFDYLGAAKTTGLWAAGVGAVAGVGYGIYWFFSDDGSIITPAQ